VTFAVATSETAAVAGVLTAAFSGDPMMVWLFPDRATHVAALGTWWRYLTERRPPDAELWMTDDGASAALWQAPRIDEPPPDDRNSAGSGESRSRPSELLDVDEDRDRFVEGEDRDPFIEGEDRDRFIEGEDRDRFVEGEDRDPFIEMVGGLVGDRLPIVLDMFARLRDAHPAELHWYLPAVGTIPAMQGRGSGRRVLMPVLDRCDSDGLPAYLESSNPRNVPFYLRLGFEVTGDITTADGGATLTGMWRRPR